jgi:hypothetical protein
LAKSETDLRDKLQISVVALAPYFTFPPGSEGDGPDARKFPIATQAAAQFYDHLRSTPAGPTKTGARDRWPFDAMFWLGDDKPAEVVRDSGGERQKNKAHFIDLLAGLTCVDYLHPDRLEGATLEGLCYFAGPKGDETENVTTWDDLPLLVLKKEEIRRNLLRFALSGAMHIGFFSGLLEDTQSDLARRPTAVPWYYERFIKTGHRLDAVPHREVIVALSNFFHEHCFPWWRDVHASAEGRLRLLNVNAFEYQEGPPPKASLQLRRLKDVLYGSEDLDQDAVHRFFCDTCARTGDGGKRAVSDGAPAYLATLAHAADQFIKREYKPRGV